MHGAPIYTKWKPHVRGRMLGTILAAHQESASQTAAKLMAFDSEYSRKVTREGNWAYYKPLGALSSRTFSDSIRCSVACLWRDSHRRLTLRSARWYLTGRVEDFSSWTPFRFVGQCFDRNAMNNVDLAIDANISASTTSQFLSAFGWKEPWSNLQWRVKFVGINPDERLTLCTVDAVLLNHHDRCLKSGLIVSPPQRRRAT
jgi:hypothetical protein